jgi:hypothetical protein
MGGIPGKELLFRQLSFSIVFTGIIGGLASQLVWTQTWLVAVVATLVSCIADLMGARTFSIHLLLLSRRLL